MGKYTYTASLVDESINILKRADQELSGTNAAVNNAVNTILNARGADRLAFDFKDIIDLTNIARDDIATVTREIINKQNEIEEYENAPWWKKLFASIGMALLKYIEGHAQAIEYIFDFAVSLAGFIGGLFNSEFKASCKEFAEKNHVDNWFTKQYINEDGWFKDVNAYSTFAYNSTAANIIEFGGSLLNIASTAVVQGLLPVASSLYKTFENLIEESETNAIVTATPIVAPKLKEIFDIEETKTNSSRKKEIQPINSDGDGTTTNKEEQFKHEETETVKEDNNRQPKPIVEDNSPSPTSQICSPEQVLYGPPPIRTTVPLPEIIEKDDGIIPGQVLYGPPTTENIPPTTSVLETHGDKGNNPIYIPKANTSETEKISKKAAGSFGDLIYGSSNTPVSSKPLSSKDNHGDSVISKPLASGVIAAGVAGWGTKKYMDKNGSTEEKDKEIDAEKWDEDSEKLNIDYEDGRIKDVEGDYLSPEDELAFIE